MTPLARFELEVFVIKTYLLVVLMMLSAQWVAAECKLDAPNTVDSAKTIMRGET